MAAQTQHARGAEDPVAVKDVGGGGDEDGEDEDERGDGRVIEVVGNR